MAFSIYDRIPIEAFELPEGFTEHEGNECPVDPDVRVECFTTTAEGVGFCPEARADRIGWSQDDPDGFHVIAYRVVGARAH